jgi:hypothetical protein
LGLFDFNNDGFQRPFHVNAHVNDNQELYNEQTYRQGNSLFLNTGNGKFQNASLTAGEDFQRRRAHRGCAFADFDNDWRCGCSDDCVNEPVELWRNESTREGHWLAIQLIGAQSNRNGLRRENQTHDDCWAVQYNQITTASAMLQRAMSVHISAWAVKSG